MEMKNGSHITDVFDEQICEKMEADNRKRFYIAPQKVLWQSGSVTNSQALVENRAAQITVEPKDGCVLHSTAENCASVLLDFGAEIHGGIKIFTWLAGSKHHANVRVRFGESAMEAMSELGGEQNATNDHAVRDMVVDLPDMSMISVGETGFRFVRIDLLDQDQDLVLKGVKGVLVYMDLPYVGSFRCNDELLNRIWKTGAYTVHLNMQNYIWDGIKRDRLVWIGDMHPETSTIQAVFGQNEAVPRSLDFVREGTPLPNWMNGYPSYSMWWMIIQHDWYVHTGDMEFLKRQMPYYKGLYQQLSTFIDESGKDCTPEPRFVDWPTADNKEAIDAGLQALHVMATRSAKRLFEACGEAELAKQCEADLEKLMKFRPAGYGGAKQALSLMVLAGLASASEANEACLSQNGAHSISTFMGYYILRARAAAGDIEGCLENIRDYWGGMLSLGATTFWEDFDMDWLENAARIDELTPAGKVNVHGAYGKYCYIGYRHSLCHGWSSGPTPWMQETILGVEVLEPGCRKIRVTPQLGSLEWAEGSFPTPYGPVFVRHEKKADGSVESDIKAPDEVEVVR